MFINQSLASTLLAFPLTTMSGTVILIKLRNFVRTVIHKTNKSISWEDVVDAEINEEMSKIGLEIESSKHKCSIM